MIQTSLPSVFPTEPDFTPRSASNTIEVQLVLARSGFSPGSIDGVPGSQTRAALLAFQNRHGLNQTGTLDETTRQRLILAETPYFIYPIQSNDLARLQPLATTWLGKSHQSRLEYESVLELVSELSWSHPNLIRRLNPEITWTNLIEGTQVTLPYVKKLPPRERVGEIRIQLYAKSLQVFNASGDLIAHFPCSIAQRVEKRPLGELKVTVVAPNPNYSFDPQNFPESAEAAQLGRKLVLPPGPNNPVGSAWIGLDRPGYGIHGTPKPEDVGRTESHGCFRLANWNAEWLLGRVRIGTPVLVEP